MGNIYELDISDKEFLEITREKFYKAVNKESSPDLAWFSLNDACNLDCKYCFADAKFLNVDPKKNIDDFLKTKDVLSIIDNVADAGTKSIMFAGGEPTLRKDLPELISYTSRYMDVAMNTNGYYVNDKMAKELFDAGLTQVKVSVDGLMKNHDWNRGEGSYEKAINAANNFKAAGVSKVMLIMTLSAVNYDDLPELLKTAMEMDVDFTVVEFLPIGKAAKNKEWCLNKEQVKGFQKFLTQAQLQYGWTRIAFENRYIVTEDHFCKSVCADPNGPCGFYDYCVGCISGIYSYIISPRGKVCAGDVFDLECGDLKKEQLKDIWQKAEFFRKIRDREALEGKCGKCKYKYICGGCRRRAFAYTGKLMASDPGCWVDPKECIVKTM